MSKRPARKRGREPLCSAEHSWILSRKSNRRGIIIVPERQNIVREYLGLLMPRPHLRQLEWVRLDDGFICRVEPASVLVSSLKPSEDGKALMVRLFNAGDAAARAILSWSDPTPGSVSLSSPFEEEGAKVTGALDLPRYGIVTLRAELPD